MNVRHIPKKKYKKPKKNTQSTTEPESSNNKSNTNESDNGDQAPLPPSCPLLAKDSEWIDILQTSRPETSGVSIHRTISEEEELLQLVECEDDPEVKKPLAILFPGLLEKDPNTLKGMLNKAMSTTEVTRHLVDLGQKANFTYMKKADRLIPRDKIWLESLAECSSKCSFDSDLYRSNMDYDADSEVTDEEKTKIVRKKKLVKIRPERSVDPEGSVCTIDTVIDRDEVNARSQRNLIIKTSDSFSETEDCESPTSTSQGKNLLTIKKEPRKYNKEKQSPNVIPKTPSQKSKKNNGAKKV